METTHPLTGEWIKLWCMHIYPAIYDIMDAKWGHYAKKKKKTWKINGQEPRKIPGWKPLGRARVRWDTIGGAKLDAVRKCSDGLELGCCFPPVTAYVDAHLSYRWKQRWLCRLKTLCFLGWLQLWQKPWERKSDQPLCYLVINHCNKYCYLLFLPDPLISASPTNLYIS